MASLWIQLREIKRDAFATSGANIIVGSESHDTLLPQDSGTTGNLWPNVTANIDAAHVTQDGSHQGAAIGATQDNSLVIGDENSEKASILHDFILDNLGFASMQDREDEVSEAHARTFEWIFDRPVKSDLANRHTFSRWLRGETSDRIYWISGKPGSGKSTLMRFLYEHPKTRKYLQEWCGSDPLFIAGFFFWISGTPEQRSQTGLLRSLLHQILDNHRKLIPVAFPSLWAQLWAASTRDRLKMALSWPLSQLKGSLKALLDELSKRSKICFFIDGLDELEGDHLELIDIFKSATAESSTVRACLSSRPFPVFEEAFSSGLTMKLQDLTLQDMITYVQDSFTNHRLAGREYGRLPELSMKLITNIVAKADGVFLWVRMVVYFLLDNWQERNTLFDALFALRKLPTELDDLFHYFLFSCQPKQYFTIASKTFQLVRAKEKVLTFTKDAYGASLTLWELALADEEVRNLVSSKIVRQATGEEISLHCERAKAYIEDCCGGLLQIHQRSRSKRTLSATEPQSLAKSKVSYIHRTARDYLMHSGVWDQLLTLTTFDDFDPHLAHVRSYILQLKLSLFPVERHRRLDEWWPDIVLAMTHARSARPSSGHTQHLLDELYNTLDQHYWGRRRSDPNDNWPRGAFFTYEQRGRSLFHDPFLSLAIKFGLTQYLSARYSTSEIPPYKSGYPLLSYAVEFLADRRKTIYPLSDPDLVLILLRAGHSPNQPYPDIPTKDPTTPWLYALRCAREADRRGWIKHYDTDAVGTERWVKILRLFVEYGADPNALIVEDEWDPSATALEVVEGILGAYASEWVLGLRDLLVEKGARAREREGDEEKENAEWPTRLLCHACRVSE